MLPATHVPLQPKAKSLELEARDASSDELDDPEVSDRRDAVEECTVSTEGEADAEPEPEGEAEVAEHAPVAPVEENEEEDGNAANGLVHTAATASEEGEEYCQSAAAPSEGPESATQCESQSAEKKKKRKKTKKGSEAAEAISECGQARDVPGTDDVQAQGTGFVTSCEPEEGFASTAPSSLSANAIGQSVEVEMTVTGLSEDSEVAQSADAVCVIGWTAPVNCRMALFP